MADPVIRLSINLPPDVAEILLDYATRHSMSKTEVVSIAVRELAKRDKRKAVQ